MYGKVLINFSLVSRSKACWLETTERVLPQVCVKRYGQCPQPWVSYAVVYKIFLSKLSCLKQLRQGGG